MPRFFRLKVLAVVLCLAIAVQAAEAPKTVAVTVLYSNDFHAAIQPMKATWLVDQPRIGGIRAFAGWVEAMQREQPNPFLFDSGDLFTGQAISFITRGRAPMDMFKTIGFDAVCYGNHEFDYGIQTARSYQDVEPFPVLAANIFYKDGRPFAKPYAIVEKNGIRVAVIGIFGVDAMPSTAAITWETLDVRDPLPILRQLVPELRTQADLIVVLAHQGETGPMQEDAEAHPEVQRNFEADKRTVEAVPGIDVFIGGHAHRGIEVPWVSPTTGSIVVQTYGRGTTLGVLHLTYDRAQHKVVQHEGGLVRIVPGIFPTPLKVEQVVERWEAESNRIGSEVLGTSAAALHRNYDGESALGDLIADAMLWKTGAQIAFENAGGIRTDLAKGPVSRADAIGVAPFINSLVTMNMTGSQIRQVLEQSLTLKVGMMQVAGLRVTYDLGKPEYHRVVSVQAGRGPLEDAQTYPVVTNSFIATGGDHYEMFKGIRPQKDTGLLVSDMLMEYILEKKTVDLPAGGRLLAVKH
ncbi:MAG: bifunctional metallophosphatase/5'-nucleotidase [Terriglobales bacterium]